MKIFKLQPLKEPSFFQRLFKITPSENVIVEVNNLLATNEVDVLRVTIDEIIDLSEKYKVDFSRKFKDNRKDLFIIYLRHCLVDSKLVENEMKELSHLRDILMLSAADVNEVIKKESARVYEQHVRETVKDGVLEETEKDRLEKIKAELLISEEVAQEVYTKSAGEIMQNFIDGAISDERLSPSEEHQMDEIARGLNIDLKIDDQSQATLDRYKLYWQIENGDLPEIEPNINIQKSEKLHFTTYIDWFEERRVVKRRNYMGPTARIKLAKGVYYRLGSLKMNNMADNEMKKIDAGQIYLTNKRLIFMGSRGNKTIRLNSILAINPYSNGVDIQKDRGKSPFLSFNDNVDIFSMIMMRLMNS